MPPILALTLCTVFVLLLLRFDRKQSPEVSRVLWIPTIWMFYIASKPLGVWFGNAGDPNEGSPLDQYFIITLLLVGFLQLIIKKFNWSRAIKENIWLIMLIGFMLASILWSDTPYVSFKRCTRQLLAVVMAFLVLNQQDPCKAVESIFRRIIYVCIPFSLLLIHYFPNYGREYDRFEGGLMWIGITLQKNGLGRLCFIAAFFLFWTLIRRWRGHDTSAVKYQTPAEIIVLIITLWLLKGPGISAMSATAVTSLSLGLMTLFGLLLMKKFKIHARAKMLQLVIAVIFILGVITVFVGGSTIGAFTSNLGRDETLTGRTDIWAKLIPLAMLCPFVGHGGGGFWSPAARQEYGVNEAHSGYLDIILDYGFVGLIFFLMFLLFSCRKAQRMLAHNYDWGSLWICYLFMAAVHNISESSLNSLTSHLTAVLLFLTVSAASSAHYNKRFYEKSNNSNQFMKIHRRPRT
jgi:exopolysaccharide production protein ExoQ